MKKITTLLLALLALVVWFRPQTTQAQTPPQWISWDFEIEFDANFTGTFHLILGYWDANDNPIETDREPITIKCKPHGNVTAVQGEATFNGGFLTCDFPNLITAANEIMADKYPGYPAFKREESVCDCEFAPDRPIYVTAKGQTTNVTMTAPVFHHPSIQFALQPEGKSYVANHLTVSGQSSYGQYQNVSGPSEFHSEYQCYPNAGLCKFRHFLNGRQNSANYDALVTPQLETAASTVFIGFNPKTGDLFQGTLNSLRVDPPCNIDGYG